LQVLREVHMLLRTVPASKLMRPDMDVTALEQSGMDQDTTTFLTNLLGFEASRGKISVHTEEDGVDSLHVPGEDGEEGDAVDVTRSLCEKPKYSFAQVTDWSNFDIFEAACSIPRGSLFLELFTVADQGFDMVAHMNLSVETLAPALNLGQTMYEEPVVNSKSNSYHTALHGADVLVSAITMLHKVPRVHLGLRLPALSKFAVVIASLFHDFHHPGLQARFLDAVNHEVSLTYLDDSPLERYHVAHLFRLLHSHGCLKTLSDSDHKRFRRLVTGMVLATDLAQGYKNTSIVKAAFPAVFLGVSMDPQSSASVSDAPKPRMRSNSVTCLDDVTTDTDVGPELLNLVVECADVSHPARPLERHQRWSILITHEFLLQGELETERGMPVSPLCSKPGTMDAASFSRAQQGFIDFVVRPKLTVLSKLCNQDGLWIKHLEDNHAFWGSSTTHGFVEVSEQLTGNPNFQNGIEAARAKMLAKMRSSVSLRGQQSREFLRAPTIEEGPLGSPKSGGR